MLFIVLAGYWFGPSVGILAGVAEGLLGLITGPYVVHPMQLLLDYPLAFAVLGISGFFKNKRWGLQIGYTAGALARWLMSFLSGVIFFASYAGDSNPIVYSAVYNFSYILPEMVITLILLFLPPLRNAIDAVEKQVSGKATA
jgi:thiamine transporter